MADFKERLRQAKELSDKQAKINNEAWKNTQKQNERAASQRREDERAQNNRLRRYTIDFGNEFHSKVGTKRLLEAYNSAVLSKGKLFGRGKVIQNEGEISEDRKEPESPPVEIWYDVTKYWYRNNFILSQNDRDVYSVKLETREHYERSELLSNFIFDDLYVGRERFTNFSGTPSEYYSQTEALLRPESVKRAKDKIESDLERMVRGY